MSTCVTWWLLEYLCSLPGMIWTSTTCLMRDDGWCHFIILLYISWALVICYQLYLLPITFIYGLLWLIYGSLELHLWIAVINIWFSWNLLIYGSLETCLLLARRYKEIAPTVHRRLYGCLPQLSCFFFCAAFKFFFDRNCYINYGLRR